MLKKPFLHSLFFIFGSCIVTTAIFFGLQSLKKNEQNNQKYLIQKILIKGQNGDFLSGDLFAELVDVSICDPTPFFAFDTQETKKKIKKTGIFRKIDFRKKRPDCLVVIYALFDPIAIVEDQANTLLNEEGRVMAYRPFFSPKKLPKVILGEHLAWNQKIATEKWLLIQSILSLDAQMITIDLRFCWEQKKQYKELVLEVERKSIFDLVRLNPATFEEEWKQYLQIKEMLPLEPQIVDLRYKDMALFEKRFSI